MSRLAVMDREARLFPPSDDDVDDALDPLRDAQVDLAKAVRSIQRLSADVANFPEVGGGKERLMYDLKNLGTQVEAVQRTVMVLLGQRAELKKDVLSAFHDPQRVVVLSYDRRKAR